MTFKYIQTYISTIPYHVYCFDKDENVQKFQALLFKPWSGPVSHQCPQKSKATAKTSVSSYSTTTQGGVYKKGQSIYVP